MEPQISQPDASSNSNRNSSNAQLCSHRTRTGRRCRLPVQQDSALCFRHASLRDPRSADADISATFTQLAEFRSAIAINDFLAKLLGLLAQNRISARQAAVLAYITSQLLRTLPAIDRELNPPEDDGPPQIIFDIPRPDRSQQVDPDPVNPPASQVGSPAALPSGSQAQPPAATQPASQTHTPATPQAGPPASRQTELPIATQTGLRADPLAPLRTRSTRQPVRQPTWANFRT